MLAGLVPSHRLLPGLAEPVSVAALAAVHAVTGLPSLTVPGRLTDQAAEGAPPLRNGANAPADNPEHADTLPARG